MSDSEDQPQTVTNGKIEDSSVEALIEGINSISVTEEEGFLQEVLEGLECPYNWKLSEITTSNDIIRGVRNKIFELNEEESFDFDHFKWNNFTLQLLLSYTLTNKGDYTEALEILDKCSNTLKTLEEENCTEPLFAKIKEALWHVNLASRVYTLLKLDSQQGVYEKNDTIEELLDKIPKISDMTDVQKAGIYGIKTHLLMQYGHDGNVLALDTAKMTRDLDPEMAEWWFLVGKAMGRIRRIMERMECVEKEEIRALEKAVELHDSTSYIVFLAQTYRECSLRAFKKFQSQVDLKTHGLGKYIDSLNEKALNLYMQALDKRQNCPSTMSRCAAGLLRLPGRCKRLQIAEQVLMKSLELAPDNAYSHHVAGLLYYNFPYRNFRKALFHYERADELGNYGASMDILRLKSEMNQLYDPYEDLLRFVEKYKPEVNQISLTCELGSYFLFKKRDIIKAIEFYTEVIKKDKVSLLKSNFVAFLSLDGPINLLKIVVDEARLALQKAEALSKEDKLAIRRFIIEISTIAPELLDGEPEENRIEEIIKQSEFRMTPKDKYKNPIGERLKMGISRTHDEQRERFQGMQERRDVRNEMENSERSEYRTNSGYSRMRGSDNRVRSEREQHGDSRFQGMRERREMRHERGHDRGHARVRANDDRGHQRTRANDDRGHLRTRGNDDRGHPRTRGNDDRGHLRTRGNDDRGRNRNWRSEGSDRRETNWRSQPNDNDQKSYNVKHDNDRDKLKNRCWRTETQAENRDEAPKDEETYRFPVRMQRKDSS